MGKGITMSIIRELEDLFVPVLRNCIDLSTLKKTHAHIIKFSLSQSSFLVTKMVDVCDSRGEMEYADLLFKQVIKPNVFLYNAMIRAYTHNYKYSFAINVYKEMQRNLNAETPISPDRFTFPFVIKSSAGLVSETLGKQLHAQTLKFGESCHLVTQNALIDMYTKFENSKDAHKVFDEMNERDAISWNSLISGYVKMMQIKKATALFDEMPSKTIVSWTAMISGYTRIGCYVDAMDAFREMQTVGIEPDEISIISVLPACAQLGALELGEWIHMYSNRKGLSKKTGVCNALIEMYAKCGCIDQANQLFKQMSDRDVISWSTMIAGLANHGKGSEAIELFREMESAKVEPNGITFLGVLAACAHAGLQQDGLRYFEVMRNDYNIEPKIEHYGCLVDLLGRSGQVGKAFDVIKKMPMEPDSKIWGSLLSSCRSWCDLDVAVIAMEHLQVVEPDDSGNYVMLSNIYADLGMWEGVARIRKLIKSKKMRKTPGCSLIEVENSVQEFVAGDDSKPFSKEIFRVLELFGLHQTITDDVIANLSRDVL